jgi:hypothetical protein
MPRSRLNRFIDSAFMAPHRVMDENGNNPYGYVIDNFLHRPAVKTTGMLCAIFATAAIVQAQPERAFQHMLAATGALVAMGGTKRMYNLISNAHGHQPLYFHTDPPRAVKTAPDAEASLSAYWNRSKFMALRGAVVFFPAPSDINPQFVTPFVTYMSAVVAADFAADFWRRRQTLKGHWTASTLPPSKQEHENKAPAPGGLWQPT